MHCRPHAGIHRAAQRCASEQHMPTVLSSVFMISFRSKTRAQDAGAAITGRCRRHALVRVCYLLQPARSCGRSVTLTITSRSRMPAGAIAFRLYLQGMPSKLQVNSLPFATNRTISPLVTITDLVF